MEISNLTKDRIEKYLNEKEKRFDNRGLLDYRNIEIEKDISKSAEGSVKVKMGKTEVAVGIKLDVTQPYPDSEDEGTLMTTVELLPLASSEYEPGPPQIKAIEIARIIDRSVRESGFIDFKKLCIEKGEKVYQVFVDIYVLNDDGNLIDAGCLGAVIALMNAKMPKYDEETGEIDRDEMTDNKLPLADEFPVTLTAHKIGEKIILDPDYNEQETSETRLSIGIQGDKVNAMQKGKAKPLSEEDVSKIIDTVFEKSEELKKIVEENTE